MKSNWTRYNLLKILHRAKTHAQKTIDRTVHLSSRFRVGFTLMTAPDVTDAYSEVYCE